MTDPSPFDELGDLDEEFDEDPLEGLLSVPGVTVKRVAAFADAAAQFHAAAPWRHLSSADIIHIEAPEVARELRNVQLFPPDADFGFQFLPDVDVEELAEAGISAEEFSEELLADGVWALTFGRSFEVPPDDLELWEQHGLPHPEDLYPVALQIGDEGGARPDPALLALFEGVLRALAATSEEEMDTGRWSQKVTTADGRIKMVLSLPDLLDPAPVIPHREPETPQERAQDLVYQAREAVGRREILLARQALELWPDCADAWLILADRATDAESARERYLAAVAAGERALGPAVFEQEPGRFWDLLETRPYMRARLGLALFLADVGEREAAIGHYRELLRLNPGDTQGVRHFLAQTLFFLQRDDELAELFSRYPDDVAAGWCYGRALLAFRREGDSPAARRHLAVALKHNRHVPKYLLDRVPLPEEAADEIHPGGEDEAGEYAFEAIELWEDTPGALDWLHVRSASLLGAGRGRAGKKKPKQRHKQKHPHKKKKRR